PKSQWNNGLDGSGGSRGLAGDRPDDSATILTLCRQRQHSTGTSRSAGKLSLQAGHFPTKLPLAAGPPSASPPSCGMPITSRPQTQSTTLPGSPASVVEHTGHFTRCRAPHEPASTARGLRLKSGSGAGTLTILSQNGQ